VHARRQLALFFQRMIATTRVRSKRHPIEADSDIVANARNPRCVRIGRRGVELCMDDANTNSVLNLIDNGSDAVAILAIVDPEVKSKVGLALAVAIVKIGARVIKSVNDAGGKRGVCISHPWIGPGPGWATAQTD